MLKDFFFCLRVRFLLWFVFTPAVIDRISNNASLAERQEELHILQLIAGGDEGSIKRLHEFYIEQAREFEFEPEFTEDQCGVLISDPVIGAYYRDVFNHRFRDSEDTTGTRAIRNALRAALSFSW